MTKGEDLGVTHGLVCREVKCDEPCDTVMCQEKQPCSVRLSDDFLGERYSFFFFLGEIFLLEHLFGELYE